MKCCLSSSSTFPLMMSVTSITAKTNQGHWVNWKMGEEGTPWGTEATVTQKRGGIISCGNFRAVYRVTWWKPALAPRPTQTLEGTGYSNQADEIWNNPWVYKCLPPPPAVPPLNFHRRIEQEMERSTPGVPATPKGLRSPDVNFLVLLSRSSILPTRTIWHTKLIFSLFRSLLPRSYKQ